MGPQFFKPNIFINKDSYITQVASSRACQFLKPKIFINKDAYNNHFISSQTYSQHVTLSWALSFLNQIYLLTKVPTLHILPHRGPVYI